MDRVLRSSNIVFGKEIIFNLELYEEIRNKKIMQKNKLEDYHLLSQRSNLHILH